jgi:hypothetical protein
MTLMFAVVRVVLLFALSMYIFHQIIRALQCTMWCLCFGTIWWYDPLRLGRCLNSVLNILPRSRKLHLRIGLASGVWVVHVTKILDPLIFYKAREFWCSLHRFTWCPDLGTVCSKLFCITSVSGYPSILDMEKRILNVCMLTEHSKGKKTCPVRIHTERSCVTISDNVTISWS